MSIRKRRKLLSSGFFTYTASSGNLVPTFRENLLVPSSGLNYEYLPLKMGPIGCPETSVRNYRYSLRNNPD